MRHDIGRLTELRDTTLYDYATALADAKRAEMERMDSVVYQTPRPRPGKAPPHAVVGRPREEARTFCQK